MNREIKFRAWDTVMNEMFYNSELSNGDLLVIHMDGRLELSDDDTYKVSDFEIMQYTGIIDKHNKQVYEGDIIRVLDPDKKHQIQQVVFQDGAFCGYSPKKTTRWTLLDILIRAHGVEVIGNVHENKELLVQS